MLCCKWTSIGWAWACGDLLKLHSFLLGVRSARWSCDRRAKICNCRRQQAVLKDQPLMQDLLFISLCLQWNACAVRFSLDLLYWRNTFEMYLMLFISSCSSSAPLCACLQMTLYHPTVLGVLLFSAALQGAKSTENTMTVHPHSSTFLFATFHLMVAYSYFCFF